MMYKNLLTIAAGLVLVQAASAQITITASDVPVSGDTIRHSNASPTTTVNLTNTGANISWNFSSLQPLSQSVDTYKTAAAVNPSYAATISLTAYGVKVADTLSTGGTALPVSVTDVYTFFNKKPAVNPTRFIAEAFAAKVSGLPTPINYSDEDEIYFFPLTYNRYDSSTYRLTYSLFGLGSFSITGVRKTRVDGWGTITTPYYTTPLNVLRLRSESIETDSVTFNGQTTAIPRHTIDYQWLPNGEHYPALWVTTNITGTTETITSIRYRDSKRSGLAGIGNTSGNAAQLKAFPNPVQNGILHLQVPAAWTSYVVEVFDVQGKLATSAISTADVNLQTLAAGSYIVRVSSGQEYGYLRISK